MRIHRLIQIVVAIGLAAVARSAVAEPFPYSLMPSTVPVRLETAQARAAHGDAEAEYWMGLYAVGFDEREPIDYVAAIAWLSKATNQGYAPAVPALAYLRGLESEMRNLQTKAQTGDPEAEYAFSNYLKQTPPSQWELTDTPELWRLRAAELGQADAEYDEGHASLDAWSKTKSEVDLDGAFEWLEKSARHGNFYAALDLSTLYALPTSRHDNTKVEYWVRIAVYRPVSVPQPFPQPDHSIFFPATHALDALCKAYVGAPQPYETWGTSVGSGFLRGKAVIAPDPVKAFECHQQEAADGIYYGQYALGYDFQFGIGTKSDIGKARDTYLAALLKQGRLRYLASAEAMIRLALIERDHGNFAQAYFWLVLAQKRQRPSDGIDDLSPERYADSAGAMQRLRVYDLADAALQDIADHLSTQTRAEQKAAAEALYAGGLQYDPYAPPVI